MVALLVILASMVGGLPLTAVLLVTVACRQEEAAHSMAGCAPGRLARAARRLLAFQAVGITRSASPAGRPSSAAEALTTAGPRSAG
jgi:hypothetical protein